METDQQSLNDSIHELFSIEELLRQCVDHDISPNVDILHLLARTAIAKLDYYNSKYNFEIDMEDHFFVNDGLKFAEKRLIESRAREVNDE